MAEEDRSIRVAAVGDIHCREANREPLARSIAAISDADLLLIAGDITSHGTVEEAQILCEVTAGVDFPVFAVLGNHDLHAGQSKEIIETLRAGGIDLLDGTSAISEIKGVEVGVVGSRGFVGGFAPHHLPDFGEPSLRAVYEETSREVSALEAGLSEVATCQIRLVVLHYSPLRATVEGEPPEIFPFLGSDRMARPLLEHGPDLVVHGHAHEGTHEGSIGEVPVRNVSLPVLGGEIWITELGAPVHGPIP